MVRACNPCANARGERKQCMRRPRGACCVCRGSWRACNSCMYKVNAMQRLLGDTDVDVVARSEHANMCKGFVRPCVVCSAAEEGAACVHGNERLVETAHSVRGRDCQCEMAMPNYSVIVY
eukprot:47845-Eustigmatos_ZCMA.PRE.1